VDNVYGADKSRCVSSAGSYDECRTAPDSDKYLHTISKQAHVMNWQSL